MWPPLSTSERHLFEIPPDVAYLNCANMSPQLRGVREAGERCLARRAAPWTIGSHDWFADVEQARALFGKVIGVDPEGVAIVPSSSYGLAVAARNLDLAPGRRVLVMHGQFPSSVYTWRRACAASGAQVATVVPDPGQDWASAVSAAVDERVAVVCVESVHWATGAPVDLDAVAGACRAVGAALVVDASQSAGAVPLALDRIRPDFLVTVGYKWLLGPASFGFLHVGERHRDGEPLEENWILRAGADDFTRLLDYQDAYLPGARRFDAGERMGNFTLPAMASAALRQLLAWGPERVRDGLAAISTQVAGRAAALGYEVPPADARSPHILGIRLSDDDGDGARDALAARLAERNVHTSVRGRSLRISPHLHVTQDDLDRLFAVLADVR